MRSHILRNNLIINISYDLGNDGESNVRSFISPFEIILNPLLRELRR